MGKLTSRVTPDVSQEGGLTLIELLIAVSILVIISGSTYTLSIWRWMYIRKLDRG